MRTELLASIALLLLLASLSCSSAPPLPPLDQHSPANPQAAEAPLPQASRAFGKLDDDAPLSGAYVCPMHDEVTSDAPGNCPRCRMALVKRPMKREDK
jgi:hypothetical protein